MFVTVPLTYLCNTGVPPPTASDSAPHPHLHTSEEELIHVLWGFLAGLQSPLLVQVWSPSQELQEEQVTVLQHKH